MKGSEDKDMGEKKKDQQRGHEEEENKGECRFLFPFKWMH